MKLLLDQSLTHKLPDTLDLTKLGEDSYAHIFNLGKLPTSLIFQYEKFAITTLKRPIPHIAQQKSIIQAVKKTLYFTR